MALRTDIFAADIEPPPSPPFILSTLNWVGNGGRDNWCWAACALMIKLFNENASPGTEAEAEARLCAVAKLALDSGSKKCCETDSCDELLSIPQVTELWEKIIPHHAVAQENPEHQAPFDGIFERVIKDLQDHKAVAMDISEDDLIGHVVVIYGFVDAADNRGTVQRFFHVRDPALNPIHLRDPHRTMRASALKRLCKNVWFNLK